MVRRATLDRGMPQAADDEALPADPASARASRAGQQSGGRPWRGGGGRWLIWVARVVAWLVLLLIGYRGVMAIITGETSTNAPATAPTAQPHSSFPSTQAQAYALEFGEVYLNFAPSVADRRAALLAQFLPPGSDSQLGWNGAGSQRLRSEQVSSIQVHSAHSATVTLLAIVDKDRLIQLGVPIYAAHGRLVVTGQPALLAPPGRAAVPQAAPVNSDTVAQAELQSQLPAFFRAYAGGGQDTLSRFLTSGARVAGLNGMVTLGQVQSVTVPAGGSTRDITVVVIWHLASGPAKSSPPPTSSAPASLTVTYRMTVVRQDASWYVQSIGTSTQTPGPP
ncbi:MAG TPA: conjugal transfer protein [Streptosporangiaceae bacterium]|nr:conjugal transfer protein [Streptosporangiaceae bacterium]